VGEHTNLAMHQQLISNLLWLYSESHSNIGSGASPSDALALS